MKRYTFLLFLLGLFFNSLLVAQSKDTIKVSNALLNEHSPKKATYLSLALPGLGQAYNKKYWKIPIVYAIIGTPLFLAIDQQDKFKEFRDALGKRVDGDPSTVDDKFTGIFTDENLRSQIDFHRRNRDIFFILTFLGYAINVIDATVDAHFFKFDVSDDLSATFKPNFQVIGPQRTIVPSINLSLKFTKKQARIIYY